MPAEATAVAEETAEIRFEEGIIGVPRARRFELLEREGSAIRVLRCLDIEGFALPVIDPRLADTAYQPVIGPRVQEALLLEAGEPILLLAVTTLEANGPVANLRAPLVINVKRRLAKQVILDDRAYPLRAPLPAQR